jgi:hypothetical protein
MVSVLEAWKTSVSHAERSTKSVENTNKKAFDHKKYKMQWDRQNTKNIGLKLNYHTDADILAHLADIKNVQGYVKQLIRDDIARQTQET